jgi:hypothetical protein
MNIRTASPEHIKTAIKILLIDKNTSEQISSEILSFMDDKLLLFKQSEKNVKESDVVESDAVVANE